MLTISPCPAVHSLLTFAIFPGNRRLLEEDAPSCEQFKCMCILDFNEILRVVKDGNEDTPAKDAKEVISECKVTQLPIWLC